MLFPAETGISPCHNRPAQQHRHSLKRSTWQRQGTGSENIRTSGQDPFAPNRTRSGEKPDLMRFSPAPATAAAIFRTVTLYIPPPCRQYRAPENGSSRYVLLVILFLFARYRRQTKLP